MAKLKNHRSQYAPPTDAYVNSGIARFAEQVAKGLVPDELASLYVETAGGVHSPTLFGTSQADAYRPLRIPTILVGSPHLGGISTTISAYESLLIRGYDIDALLCFKEDYYENHKYFEKWVKEKGISLGVVERPPDNAGSHGAGSEADIAAMKQYYDSLLRRRPSSMQEGGLNLTLGRVIESLQQKHARRIQELDTAAPRTRSKVWWPFVQHQHIKEDKDVMVIESAHGDSFQVWNQSTLPSPTSSSSAQLNNLIPTFDGSASWWTQCLGHSNVELTLAAARAAGRYGHVLFPTATNLPALQLSEKLLDTVGKGWASRVFFSDDGSTGMEVALKMGMRYTANALRQQQTGVEKVVEKEDGRLELGVLGLKGSYHGDTIGAMDASEPSVYSTSVEWYRGRGAWLDPPTVRLENRGVVTLRLRGEQWDKSLKIRDGKDMTVKYPDLGTFYNVPQRMREKDPLVEIYNHFIETTLSDILRQEPKMRFGALVLEPIVMGAGGMLFVDPLFQRLLIDYVRSPTKKSNTSYRNSTSIPTSLPVIFDEVFVGLRRLGPLTCSSILDTKPDIAVYAKILTGGLVPMSVTLATEKVYESFLGDEKAQALLHGHSYTAHPIGCGVANRTLELIEGIETEPEGEWARARKDWSKITDPQITSSEGSDTQNTSISVSVSALATKESATEMSVFSLWKQDFVQQVTELNGVEGAMAMGTVLAIYLRDTKNAGYQSTASLSLLQRLRNPTDPEGLAIHARPLGNTVYWMSSLNTSRETLEKVETAIMAALQEREKEEGEL